jgi:hypothetical protein
MVGAGFNLDKHDHSTIEHDQIDFASLAAIIALDQSVTLFPEKILGDLFTFLPQPFSEKTHLSVPIR